MRFAMRFHHLIIALAAASSLLTAAAAQVAKGRLAIDGGEFRLHLDDGRVLQREALVGAHVVIHNGAETIRLLIDAVVEDKTSSGKPLVLYRLLIEDASGQVQEACQPDARGRRLGMPLLKETGITLTCTSGAEGKCILMGYRPWEESADVPMRDLHAACIHMVRADYGGDDRATTRDGTIIDVYDRFGIQLPDAVDPMPFEAAWGKDGVRVNAVAPGWIATPLTQALQDDPERSGPILSRTPMGRWGKPEEVADAVVFLASPAARFITGAILAVDGGYLTL